MPSENLTAHVAQSAASLSKTLHCITRPYGEYYIPDCYLHFYVIGQLLYSTLVPRICFWGRGFHCSLVCAIYLV